MPVKQAKKRECITTYERTEDKMRGTIKGFLIVVFHAKGKEYVYIPIKLAFNFAI